MERNSSRRRQTPSFSSSLLHAIDRSIDEADGVIGVVGTRVTNSCKCACTAASANNSNSNYINQHYGRTRNTKFGVKEKYVFNSASTSSYGGFSSSEPESSIGVVDTTTRNTKLGVKEKYVFNSASTSSYGGFSSSEPESSIGVVDATPNKQKKKKKKNKQQQQNPKSLGNRFRASKLYAEIKKAKSPASPGARLANFVNQLFTSSTTSQTKNAKTATNQNLVNRYRSYSTTSSSHLTKTLSSKLAVTIDEDIIDDDGTRSYCSSSDLFELENLTGVSELESCYVNELPVYETTHLQTNRDIARRLIA